MKIPHTETSGTQDETENSENSSLAWRIESNEELITWNHWMKYFSWKKWKKTAINYEPKKNTNPRSENERKSSTFSC